MSGEYSREQLEKMQKDAERRVMEMQRRSKGAVENESASFNRVQPSDRRDYGDRRSDKRPFDSRSPVKPPFDFDKPGQEKNRSDARPSPKNPDGRFMPCLSGKPRLLELLNINKMLNDPDDRLVLLLIALLSGEGADPMLLLSLLYIIL